MSAQHTQGRISAAEKVGGVFAIRDADGTPIAGAYLHADALRLAACWNACDGLTAEQLERCGTLDRANVSRNVAIQRHIELLTSQRDELLVAIRTVASVAHCGGLANLSEADALTRIRRATVNYFDPNATDSEHRAAIAKAKGGAA